MDDLEMSEARVMVRIRSSRGGRARGWGMDEFGVVRGQVCPECGVEDAIRVLYGLPDERLARAAERGLVALAGCILVEGQGAFVCRACSHAWGHAEDPSADEQELAELIGVRYDDVVRAVGTGWRRVRDDEAGVVWFVSGVPAQVAVGVGAGSITVAPIAAAHDVTTAWDHGRSFSRDDVLCSPEWVAQATDKVARARRRTFRWCPTCREARAPEDFAGYRGVCRDCGVRHHGLER